MNIRRFDPRDASFCFRTRSSAFIQKFYGEIGPQAVAACINALLPEDYVRLAQEIEFFVVEEGDRPVGFFTLKRIDERTAELPLIYIALDSLGAGIGSQCIRFMEEWIASQWDAVDTFIVDTIIPEYNGGFYRKMGFEPAGRVVCEYPTMKISAMRFKKNLGVKENG